MNQAIGYKLIKVSDNTVVDSWGGISGQLSSPPPAIYLPDNIQVHCPEMEVDYFGHKLVYMYDNSLVE